MARAGITYQDVAKAADQLKAIGENPTVDRVREKLGDTGSKSTILPFLREWRAQAFDTTEDLLESLPYHLLASFIETWKQLNKTTDARLAFQSEQNQKEIDALKETLDHSQCEKDTLHTQLKQETDKNQILRLENTSLESELCHEQQEHTKLRERYAAQTQQLDEAKLKNKDLHILVDRFQTNLEHYQAANQELHLKHDLALEKQQGEFQRERNDLLQQIQAYQAQKQTLETELQVKNVALKTYQILQDDHHRLTINYHGQQQALAILDDKYHHLEKICQQQVTLLQEKTATQVALEKQSALLTERLSSLTKNLQQTEARAVELNEEKRELVQLIKSIKAHVE